MNKIKSIKIKDKVKELFLNPPDFRTLSLISNQNPNETRGFSLKVQCSAL